MNQLAITLSPHPKTRKVTVELDMNQFERLASNLGFFSPAFLTSLDRAEQDLKMGRVHEPKSLKVWRKKK